MDWFVLSNLSYLYTYVEIHVFDIIIIMFCDRSVVFSWYSSFWQDMCSLTPILAYEFYLLLKTLQWLWNAEQQYKRCSFTLCFV